MCDHWLFRLTRYIDELNPSPAKLFNPYDDCNGIVPLGHFDLLREDDVVRLFNHVQETHSDPVIRNTAAAYLLYINFVHTDCPDVFRREAIILDRGNATLRLVYHLMRTLPAFIRQHDPTCLQPDRDVVISMTRPVIPPYVMRLWLCYKDMMGVANSSMDLEVGQFIIDHFGYWSNEGNEGIEGIEGRDAREDGNE